MTHCVFRFIVAAVLIIECQSMKNWSYTNVRRITALSATVDPGTSIFRAEHANYYAFHILEGQYIPFCSEDGDPTTFGFAVKSTCLNSRMLFNFPEFSPADFVKCTYAGGTSTNGLDPEIKSSVVNYKIDQTFSRVLLLQPTTEDGYKVLKNVKSVKFSDGKPVAAEFVRGPKYDRLNFSIGDFSYLLVRMDNLDSEDFDFGNCSIEAFSETDKLPLELQMVSDDKAYVHPGNESYFDAKSRRIHILMKPSVDP